jgi:outer membrane receptor protein involved in Fe transport
MSSSYNWKINARLFLKIGLQDEIIAVDLFNQNKPNVFAPEKVIWDYKGTTNLAQAYAHLKVQLTEKLTLNSGIHSQYFFLNQSKSLEPRLGLNYQVNTKNSIHFGYGLHSQMQPINVYFLQSTDFAGTTSYNNTDLGFTKSQHVVLGYQVNPWKDWRVKTEAYYQTIHNVPVNSFSSSYSMLNTGSSFKTDLTDSLVNGGTGTNYGLELTVEKFFSKGFYGLLTGRKRWCRKKYGLQWKVCGESISWKRMENWNG